MTELELRNEVHKRVTDLSHKHLNISLTLIGVLVVVVLVFVLAGWSGLKLFDVQLARAQKAEEQFLQDRKELTTLLSQSQAQRTQDAAQQKVIVQVVHDRNTSTDSKIASVSVNTAPDAVIKDLNAAYHGQIYFNLNLTPDGKLAFPVEQIPSFSVTKLDRDRLEANLADSTKLFTLEQDKTTSLTKDLAQSQITLKDCQVAEQKYKKAATMSKFKKFMSGVEKVAIFAGGIYLGRKF